MLCCNGILMFLGNISKISWIILSKKRNHKKLFYNFIHYGDTNIKYKRGTELTQKYVLKITQFVSVIE